MKNLTSFITVIFLISVITLFVSMALKSQPLAIISACGVLVSMAANVLVKQLVKY